MSNRNFTILNTGFLFCESRMKRKGGAIRLYNSEVTCENCSFLNCISNGDGGGIGCVEGSEKEVELLRCIFGSNVADASGGAIYLDKPVMYCDDSSFFHNMAVTKGGAIYAGSGSEFSYVVFIRNIKNGNGRCVFDDMSSGGAILTTGASTLLTCLFNKNQNINGECNGIPFCFNNFYLFKTLFLKFIFFYSYYFKKNNINIKILFTDQGNDIALQSGGTRIVWLLDISNSGSNEVCD
jgi:predicted outer membrane repeat protein